MKLTKEVELGPGEINAAIIDYAKKIAGGLVEAHVEWKHPKFADTWQLVKDFKVVIRG